jgi:hypothetical protein
MAASYNPTYLKKIDLICDKTKNSSTSIFNELIKDWFLNYNLPNNIEDIMKNSNKEDSINYIQNIINFINTKKEQKIGKIYWDIEAQKFLIE